jgi:hypothetical protein
MIHSYIVIWGSLYNFLLRAPEMSGPALGVRNVQVGCGLSRSDGCMVSAQQ